MGETYLDGAPIVVIGALHNFLRTFHLFVRRKVFPSHILVAMRADDRPIGAPFEVIIQLISGHSRHCVMSVD